MNIPQGDREPRRGKRLRALALSEVEGRNGAKLRSLSRSRAGRTALVFCLLGCTAARCRFVWRT